MHFNLVVLLINLSVFQAQEISDSINAFTIDLLAAINSDADAPGNIAISPYTVWNLLSIIDEGAKGKTAQQIESALRIPSQKTKFRRDFRNKTNLLQGVNQDVDLSIFNSAFTNVKEKLKSKYQDVIRNFYGVTVQPTDFSNQILASEKINSYVAQATKNRITSLIQPNDLDNADVFLVSALHFKGAWTFPFNESLTKPAKFHDENGETLGNVSMMHQIAPYPFSRIEWLKSNAIELPYGHDDQMSLVLILPNKDETITNTINLMRQTPFSRIMEKIDKMKEEYEGENIELFLPKFKAASDLNLNVILRKMGIRDLFDVNSADLTNMSNYRLYVTRVIHRAEIEVNEEGTEASAASGAGIINRIPPPTVMANRPFIYFILHKKTKSIIFAGKLTLPEFLK